MAPNTISHANATSKKAAASVSGTRVQRLWLDLHHRRPALIFIQQADPQEVRSGRREQRHRPPGAHPGPALVEDGAEDEEAEIVAQQRQLRQPPHRRVRLPHRLAHEQRHPHGQRTVSHQA